MSLKDQLKPPAPARILIVDIERVQGVAEIPFWDLNSWKGRRLPHDVVTSWPRTVCLAWKWLGDRRVQFAAEWEDGGNEGMMRKAWDLYNEADVIVGHNACVERHTKILKQDLTWVEAGELKVGDKLVGFDERTLGNWNGAGERKVAPSEVTDIVIEPRECLEVEFDNGDKVVTTPDHYWLGMSINCRNQQWYRTDRLKVGQRVNKFTSPWEADTSYEAGWLAGFLDGEGSMSAGQVTFCQRPNPALARAVEFSVKLGIDFSVPKGRDTYHGIGRGDALYAHSRGGKWNMLKILGQLQPARLIANIDWTAFGGLNSNLQADTTRTIVAVRPVGVKEVAVMATSTKTYIADGYPMHNCNFDTKKLKAEWAVLGMKAPSQFKVYDTLSVARQQFSFESNTLDSLCKRLGIASKTDHYDVKVANKAVAGDRPSQRRLEKYNRGDILATEAAYLRLRAWSTNGVNLGLFVDNLLPLCPACGSSDLTDRTVADGPATTGVSKYPKYQCKQCGAWSRGKRATDVTTRRAL